jgi:hypothetical protein
MDPDLDPASAADAHAEMELSKVLVKEIAMKTIAPLS